MLGGDPSYWQIEEQTGLPPRINNAGDCHFSISHSGPWVACAFSHRGRIGLDIERRTRPREVLDLAEFAFHADELTWLKSLDADQRLRSFYWLWTAKEAWIKYDRMSATPGELSRRCIIDRQGNLATAIPKLYAALQGELMITLAGKSLPAVIPAFQVLPEIASKGIPLALNAFPVSGVAIA